MTFPRSLLYHSFMHPFSTHLNKFLSAARAPAMCLELSYKLSILTNNPEVGLYSPILQMRKLRIRRWSWLPIVARQTNGRAGILTQIYLGHLLAHAETSLQ